MIYAYIFFYIAAGSILPVLIHINKDKEPEINAFGETFAQIEFTQVVKRLQVNNTVFARSLPSTIHVLAMTDSAAFITSCSRDTIFLKFHINSTIARIYPL